MNTFCQKVHRQDLPNGVLFDSVEPLPLPGYRVRERRPPAPCAMTRALRGVHSSTDRLAENTAGRSVSPKLVTRNLRCKRRGGGKAFSGDDLLDDRPIDKPRIQSRCPAECLWKPSTWSSREEVLCCAAAARPPRGAFLPSLSKVPTSTCSPALGAAGRSCFALRQHVNHAKPLCSCHLHSPCHGRAAAS